MLQNDFCSGGSLAVPEGDAVIPLLNRLRHTCAWDLIVLTQDWHPKSHASFASNNCNAPLFSVKELPDMGEQVRFMRNAQFAVLVSCVLPTLLIPHDSCDRTIFFYAR